MSTIIAIGTTNPGKVQAVRDTIAAYDKLSGPSVVLLPCKVESGVSDQPMTMAESARGAESRALRARSEAMAKHRDTIGGVRLILGVGMESGLFEGPNGKLFDVCACVIFDGVHPHLGFSCAWALPDRVTAKIREEGMDMTQAANATSLCNDPKIGDKGGLIAVLTGGRVTRPQYTIQSIQMALLAMDPQLYDCSEEVPLSINEPPALSSACSEEVPLSIHGPPAPSSACSEEVPLSINEPPPAPSSPLAGPSLLWRGALVAVGLAAAVVAVRMAHRPK